MLTLCKRPAGTLPGAEHVQARAVHQGWQTRRDQVFRSRSPWCAFVLRALDVCDGFLLVADLCLPRAGYGFGRRICPGKHIAEVSSSPRPGQLVSSGALTVHLESPRTALPLYRLLPPSVGSLAQAFAQPANGQGGTPLGRRLFRRVLESPALVHVQDRTERRLGPRGGRARVAGSGSGEGRSQVVRGWFQQRGDSSLYI